MSIYIVGDSASDTTKEEAQKLGITIIPLTVTFGEESYKDGVTMDHDSFFTKLIETDTLPVTSQISPFEYETVFRGILERDPDAEILCVTISSKLSGCFQSANIAKEEFADRHVRIVDSEMATIGEKLLMECARKMIEEGRTLDEIADELDRKKKKICLIALLDTLEYLKKGGRISATVAVAGNLLSIKPVITFEDGEVKLLGMARGSKNGNNKLKELIVKVGGIDFSNPYGVIYSGLSTVLLDKYLEDSKELYEGHIDSIPRSSIGATIGTHIGPGAIGAVFFTK